MNAEAKKKKNHHLIMYHMGVFVGKIMSHICCCKSDCR